LATNNVGAREHNPALRIDSFARDWSLARVGTIGEESENKEAKEKHKDRSLNPVPGYEQGAPRRRLSAGRGCF